jgi:hypothetical protein
MRRCFSIFYDYLRIDTPGLPRVGSDVPPVLISLKGLLPALTTSRARDAALAPHVLEYLVAVISADSVPDPQQALTHVLESMLSTGYLAALVDLLRQAFEYNQDPRPNKQAPGILGTGENSLFSLLARITLLSPEKFVQAITATQVAATAKPTSTNTNTLQQPIQWLFSEWLTSVDTIGDVLTKKLHVLGLTSLLTVAPSTSPLLPILILENLQSLFTIWTDISIELGQEAAEEAQGDYLWNNRHGGGGDVPEWNDASPEDGRKRVVSNRDPIYGVNIRHFIAVKLRVLVELAGGQEVFEREWLSRVDGAVVKAFVELGIL